MTYAAQHASTSVVWLNCSRIGSAAVKQSCLDGTGHAAGEPAAKEVASPKLTTKLDNHVDDILFKPFVEYEY